MLGGLTLVIVAPPLRTDIDRQALLAGVLDDTIDMITSDHNPIDIEHKKMEFDMAKKRNDRFRKCGTLIYHLKNNRKINSRKKISEGKCMEGAKANLTLFTPEGGSVFTKHLSCQNQNSAF
jgi:dihydroorotase